MEEYVDSFESLSVDDTQLDVIEVEAREHLRPFFEQHTERVFFSRQIEVQNEDRYFHWITNRAIRDLEAEGTTQKRSPKITETRKC